MSNPDPSSQPNPPNSSPSNPPPGPHETGYTFSDDPWIRWRNTFRYLTGRLTEEGRRQYKQGRDERCAADDCKRCEDQRDYLLRYSQLTHTPPPRGLPFLPLSS